MIVIDDDMNDAMEENPEEDPDEGSCVESSQGSSYGTSLGRFSRGLHFWSQVVGIVNCSIEGLFFLRVA